LGVAWVVGPTRNRQFGNRPGKKEKKQRGKHQATKEKAGKWDDMVKRTIKKGKPTERKRSRNRKEKRGSSVHPGSSDGKGKRGGVE